MKSFFPSSIPAVALVVLILVCVGAGCLENSAGHTGRTPGKLSVYFLDVGQGNSTLFVFGNTTILIDAGETDMGDRVVGDLHRLGIDHIDLLVATHPNSIVLRISYGTVAFLMTGDVGGEVEFASSGRDTPSMQRFSKPATMAASIRVHRRSWPGFIRKLP